MSKLSGNSIDLSIVVTFHNEEYLVGATIGSLLDALKQTEQRGIQTRVFFALDRASETTEKLVRSHAADLNFDVLEFDLGDQGLVRNGCVSQISGDYIAFLDGDDLFGYDWLWRGLEKAVAAEGPVIVHPEINLYFEGHYSFFVHCASDDPYFDRDFIRVSNYWDAMCLTRREIFVEFPYRKRDVKLGFAYEDWDWNMRTLAAGIKHDIAMDTIHFKRRRKQSQSKISRDRGAIYHPNELSYYEQYDS